MRVIVTLEFSNSFGTMSCGAEKWWGTKWRLFLQIRCSKVKWNETSVFYKLRGLKVFELLRNQALGLHPFIGCLLDWRKSWVLLQVIGCVRKNIPCQHFLQSSIRPEMERYRSKTYISLRWFPLISPLQYCSTKSFSGLRHTFSRLICIYNMSSSLSLPARWIITL